MTNLILGSFLYPSIPVLIGAAIFWLHVSRPNTQILLLSTIGSLIDIMSIALVYIALSKGPGGPITAICSMSSVLAMFIEAVRHRKLPSWLEFLALVFGLLGALEFVVPKLVHKIFCNCYNIKL